MGVVEGGREESLVELSVEVRREVRDEMIDFGVLVVYRRIAEMQTRKEKRVVFMKGRGSEGLCSRRD